MMNTNTKWFALAAVAMVFAGLQDATAQSAGATATPQIITSGNGEAKVTPDRATVFVGVQSRAATAVAAGADNARRQKAVLDTLRALGLGSADLATINYNVSPEMKYDQPTGQSHVTGYVVTNTVRAQLKRIEDVGKVIDAVLAKGANEISSLQFSSSKADSARKAALAEAVANARADAEAIARAAGGSLGPVIELSTTSNQIRPMQVMNLSASVRDAVRTPIEPGEEVINASVTARWTYVPR
jgi:uncharacterized protein YggE